MPYKDKEKKDRKNREWREKNPRRLKNAWLERDFGIDLHQYDTMVAEQGGVCLICKQKCQHQPSLTVDHNHSTGEVRGLLCMKCNSILGMFDDSPELLTNAIEYLEASGIDG